MTSFGAIKQSLLDYGIDESTVEAMKVVEFNLLEFNTSSSDERKEYKIIKIKIIKIIIIDRDIKRLYNT